jgi:hypothetical protein
MDARAIPAEAEATNRETENDRFKRSFGSWFWGSMITATVFHFVVFQFWPTRTVVDVSFSADEVETILLPPEIEIPPPPDQIPRPATPIMSPTEIDTSYHLRR